MPTMRDKSSKEREKDKSDTEEPKLVLFKTPTYKPKAFKKKTELKDLKEFTPMDIRLYSNEMKFYPEGKKKVKKSVKYSTIEEVTKFDGSPELVQVIAKSKGKNKYHRFLVADEVNRRKLYEILEGKESHSSERKSRSPVDSSGASEDNANADTDGGGPSIRDMGFSTSNRPKKKSYMAANYHQPTREHSREEDSSLHTRPAIRSARVDSSKFSLNYDDENDDFNSIEDQLTHNYHRDYPSSRHQYAKSRLTYEPDYSYDDYDEETSSYGYDYTESEETLVTRPTKPRSLTFYTPFLRVPPSKTQFYS
ncbi:hypothetical protein Aperf_G00000036866 [Anoplocephala perfoliata]